MNLFAGPHGDLKPRVSKLESVFQCWRAEYVVGGLRLVVPKLYRLLMNFPITGKQVGNCPCTCKLPRWLIELQTPISPFGHSADNCTDHSVQQAGTVGQRLLAEGHCCGFIVNHYHCSDSFTLIVFVRQRSSAAGCPARMPHVTDTDILSLSQLEVDLKSEMAGDTSCETSAFSVPV